MDNEKPIEVRLTVNATELELIREALYELNKHYPPISQVSYKDSTGKKIKELQVKMRQKLDRIVEIQHMMSP